MSQKIRAMDRNKNLALIGFMGCGKSAVGRVAAESIGYQFIDCDTEIQRRTAMTIPYIFETHGEGYFRALEKEVILDLSKTERSVIATGGGAVKDQANIDCLKINGIVIYLQVQPWKIYRNIQNDRSRPLLNGVDDKLSKITAMLHEREPLYIASADIVIETTDMNINAAATAVIDAFNAYL